MKFTLASSNEHKVEELNKLLAGSGLEISSAPKKLEVVEDGSSFQENAYIKAKAYASKFGGMSVSDDSGLVVPAMPEILGIYSARFCPEHADYESKCKALINIMNDLKDDDRKAYFVCYLCFYISEDEIYYFEGRVNGSIGLELRGNNGFGYDPVFYPDGQDGKALAELGEWKMLNSHRAKATKEALKFFTVYKTGCQI